MNINNTTQIMLSSEPRKRCVDPDYYTDGDDTWWVSSKRKRMEQPESDMKEDVVVMMMKNEKHVEESIDEKMHPITTSTGYGNFVQDDSLVKAIQKKKQIEKVVIMKREFEQEKVHVSSATTGSISCSCESFMKDIQQKNRVH